MHLGHCPANASLQPAVLYAPKPAQLDACMTDLQCCSKAPPCRYELFIDELPVWGFVGPPPEETPEDDAVYLWTHKLLKIGYNDNRVSHI